MRLFDLSGYLLLSGLLAVLAALWVLGGRKWAGWRKSKGLAQATKDHPGQPTERAKANEVVLQTYSRRQTAVEATAIVLVAAGVLCQFIDVWKEKAMATTPPPVDVATLIANSESALRQEWKRDIATATSATNGRLDVLDSQLKDLQRRVKALEDRFQGGGGGGGSGKGGGGPDPDRPPQPGSGGGGARTAKTLTLQELADQVSGLEIRVTTVEHTMHVPLRVGVPIETV